MLPDRVSNPGPLTYESGALPIALRGPAFLCKNKQLYIILLSLAGKRDIGVTILAWCMCFRASVRLPRFVRTITCTIMHGFQNNLAQLLPLRRRSAI